MASTSNLNLTLGFKGQLKLNAQAVPLQEGYLKLGGIVDATETAGLKFGLVASCDPNTPDSFTKGCASGNVVRGVVVFDDAIAQNAPAHPDKYLAGLPCAVLNHGFMWLASWTKTATDAIDPELGCKVIYNATSGIIEFLDASDNAPEGWAVLDGASVRDVDADNGALVFLN